MTALPMPSISAQAPQISAYALPPPAPAVNYTAAPVQEVSKQDMIKALLTELAKPDNRV